MLGGFRRCWAVLVDVECCEVVLNDVGWCWMVVVWWMVVDDVG